jgi:hypothetical protein
VLGDTVALTPRVVEEEIAACEGGFDTEGVDDRSADGAEVDVFEGFEEGGYVIGVFRRELCG